MRKNDVAADWQFLAVFDSFLGFKGFKNPIEPIFFTGEFTKTNFSSKFQFLEKMMAVPPRTKLVQRICWCGHVHYVSKVLKIGFVFFGNNFRVMDLLFGTVCNYIYISTYIHDFLVGRFRWHVGIFSCWKIQNQRIWIDTFSFLCFDAVEKGPLWCETVL